ncbi:MAG TPA: glutaminyl-peptide cyclotransferase, partial [Mucilaginibacter sp.]|nr:glutaminyl-peptide cyclotransferase [Mucilaginibacter sp.]
MKTKTFLFFAMAILAYGGSSCNKNKPVTDITLSPDAGTRYKAGDVVPVKVNNQGDSKPDSVVYLVDSVRVESK